MGGLGNQLFQYAAGRALALRKGTGLALDLRWYHDWNHDYWLPYELDRFRIEVVRGPRADGEYLVGYWQSEQNFADAKEQIRAELQLTDPPYVPLLESTVCVHVRRGSAPDYTGAYKTASDFGELPESYYREAVLHICTQYDGLGCIVVSDDPGWCLEHLDLGRDFTVSAGTGIEDFYTMTRCAHNVVANSSYSWWGAWLNPNPDKIVVAPSSAGYTTPQAWHVIGCPS